MIKSKFMTMVISPMLQGMNILITHGTLEIGEVPKSALQERAMPMVMVKIPTRNMQQRCGKYCLCKLRTPLKKIKDAYVRQSLLYKNVYIVYHFCMKCTIRLAGGCKAFAFQRLM